MGSVHAAAAFGVATDPSRSSNLLPSLAWVRVTLIRKEASVDISEAPALIVVASAGVVPIIQHCKLASLHLASMIHEMW